MPGSLSKEKKRGKKNQLESPPSNNSSVCKMSTTRTQTGMEKSNEPELNMATVDMQTFMDQMKDMKETIKSQVASLSSSMKTEMTTVKDSILSVKGEITSLKTEMKSVKKEVTSIKTDLKSTNREINTVKHDFGELSARVTGVETWIEARENDDTKLNDTAEECVRQVKAMQTEIINMKSMLDKTVESHHHLSEQTLKLESQSRRDNLVIHGVPEELGETDVMCYQKIVNILTAMQIQNPHEVRIARCHRLGPKRRNYVRPIIFKLHWFGDRTRIWSARGELRTYSYPGVARGKVFLTENYPAEIERRRNILKPIAKAAGKADHEVSLSVDKLIIDSKVYTVNTLDKIPPEFDPKRISTPCENNITAFFSSMSPLSNFYPVQIKDPDGTVYASSEQMYQHKKSMFHNDDATATKVMKARTPLDAYLAGKEVKGQHESDWFKGRELSKEQMYRCCIAKFSSDPALRDFLLSTGDTILAEGNPKDDLWGVKLSVHDSAIFDRSNWNGKNWLGDVLTRVREEIRQPIG